MGLYVTVTLVWGILIDENKYDELINPYRMFTKTIAFKECIEKYVDWGYIKPENVATIKIYEFGNNFVEYLNHQISDIPKIKFYYNDDHIVLGCKVDDLCDTKAGFNTVTTSVVNMDKLVNNAEKFDDYIKDVCDLLEMRWMQGSVLVVTNAN